ncbi:MAG: D-sedoheptulose-7-phosphate isomerase [Acidimicrobiales bacterium]
MTPEPTGFLYPFIESEERDTDGLLADLARSARSKIDESLAVRSESLARCDAEILAAGRAMAGRFRQGGRLLAFGNGGSSTDADGTVALFREPPSGRPLPALSLVDDRAVLTALANDVGFDVVFSRQLIAHGRDVDIAVGFSTSGGSSNVLRAFEEASRRRMLTVGLAGYDGGPMASAVDHCLVVRSQSIHRIQEAQDALMLRLWSVVQEALP